MGKLDGRVALVTGAGTSGGSGMGEFAVKELAAQGAKVVVCAHSMKNAVRVANEIIADGGEAVPFELDVASAEQNEQAVKLAIDTFGRLDVLCLVAGTTIQAPIDEMTKEQFTSMVDINLMQAFYLCHYAVPQMKKQKYGRIVVYASRGAFGVPEAPVKSCGYAASKAAAIGFCAEVAIEAESWDGDFRVNCVLPAAATALFPNQRKAAYGGTPSPYPAGPEMTAPMPVYLCSEECVCNGEVFYVAGTDVALFPRYPKAIGYMHKGNYEKWTVDELAEQVPGAFGWYFETRPHKSNYDMKTR